MAFSRPVILLCIFICYGVYWLCGAASSSPPVRHCPSPQSKPPFLTASHPDQCPPSSRHCIVPLEVDSDSDEYREANTKDQRANGIADRKKENFFKKGLKKVKKTCLKKWHHLEEFTLDKWEDLKDFTFAKTTGSPRGPRRREF